MRRSKTLARASILRHPSGTSIPTPLLVPSFSSKGFGSDADNRSEIGDIFKVASEILTETMLVSAYDIHQRFLSVPERSITDLTFLDSGGYEIAPHQDLSAIFHQPSSSGEWRKEMLISVLDKWPAHVPAVFVNYDHPRLRKPLDRQISDARSLLSHYPHHLHEILVKPENKRQLHVQVNNVIGRATELGSFNVIGLTEKEIGGHPLDRMKAIAEIRMALDDAGVSSPIHIFGSLDPITSVLYFLAGAEIFDGLTWLRFGYLEGHAIYIQNFGALKVGIERRQDRVKADVIAGNYHYLMDLQKQMRTFVVDQDFSRFRYHRQFFKDSFDLLRTKNRRLS